MRCHRRTFVSVPHIELTSFSNHVVVGTHRLIINAFEQEMKIHQARIGLPSMEQFLGALVVQRALPPQPLLQVVPRTHIIPRKDIEAPTAAQENIFGRPAANSAQLLQSCASCCIVEICESSRIRSL